MGILTTDSRHCRQSRVYVLSDIFLFTKDKTQCSKQRDTMRVRTQTALISGPGEMLKTRHFGHKSYSYAQLHNRNIRNIHRNGRHKCGIMIIKISSQEQTLLRHHISLYTSYEGVNWYGKFSNLPKLEEFNINYRSDCGKMW